MKIGIITYHRAKNLGAMLQSYALQHTVEKYIGNCEIIDYRSDKLEEHYKIKRTKGVKGIKEKIKNILLMKKNKQFEMVREEFNKNNQKISKNVYDKTNIVDANKEYDLFITGSDQVWNLKLNYQDKNFFLKFVTDNKKKNSYAASFGVSELQENEKKEIKEEIEQFNKISVREKEGKKIIQNLIKRNCEVVLDPTLLLKKEDWEILIDPKRLVKEKYIFVYIIAYTPTLLEFARKLAKERNCKIICFHSSYQKYRGMKNLNKVSPQDFLNYIQNAECVVTSSFHGLCFSINLQNEFFYELDEGKRNNNSRLTTLTSILNLENRRIINGKCNDTKSINYAEVEKKLEKEREKSIKFIKELGE